MSRNSAKPVVPADAFSPLLKEMEIAEAEQAWREPIRLEQLRSEATQITQVASYEHEVDRGIVCGSNEFCRIFGIDPATFRGTHVELLERVHPDDRERILEQDRAQVRYQTPYGDYRVVQPDGTVRILRRWAHAVADARGHTERVYAIVQDITDQRQAELKHRALEARFARTFENAPFAMSLVSAQPDSLGRYVKVNQAYCEIVGIMPPAMRRELGRLLVASA